jgi:NADH dehydrogenase/NADH:ubiquinone oxidoreductase subunit G
MFRRLEETSPRPGGTLTYEGRIIPFRAGDSVAAALLAAGIAHFRDHPVSGKPQAPYCMMGVCFECLVTIDGDQNRQSCLIPAEEGMVVERQAGALRLP